MGLALTHALGGLTRPLGGPRNQITMRSIFRTRTAIVYDPQDLTTLYQDAQGTLPVYRPGTGLVDPPVGLMMDKGQGLELGPELWDGVLDVRDAETGSAGAYNPATGELSNGAVGTSSTNPAFVGTNNPIIKGNHYRVHLKFSGDLAPIYSVTLNRGSAVVAYGNGAVSGSDLRTLGGEIVYIANVLNDTPSLRIATDGRTTWNGLFIDSISIREIKGYHAYQSTTTALPTLSGRYNLLTATETLSTQSVTTAATTYTLSFSGTGTITLSGTATGAYSAGTHTITCTAGTLTCTVVGTVTRADLRVKRDGSSLPAYQRVDSANTYDTAGFPLYLKRDKVDDDLIVQAPAITGAWAHGTIDGPVIGTVNIPAGEYHPFGTVLNVGLPDCTQWIAINGPLSASEQAVFERYVYSKARQLIDADQFVGVVDFRLMCSTRPDIKTLSKFSVKPFSANTFLQYIALSTNTISIDISEYDFSKTTSCQGFASGCTSLATITVGAAFDNTTCTNFTSAFLNTKLNQASIDAILVSINTAGTSNGTFSQSGGSAPSATGQAAITAMRSRGWTVAVTGGF